MKLYEYCFSPTGGCRKVSEALCCAWDCEKIMVDLTLPEGTCPAPGKGDVCIVTAPAYSGRVPGPEAQRLQKLKGNGAAAILVAVYGNRAYEDTLAELKDLLTGRGFRCIAAVAAVAEHSIMRQFAAGRPDNADMEQLKAFGKRIREAVERGGLEDGVTVPGNRPYRAVSPSVLQPAAGGSCTRCGLCAQNCPVGAIPREEPFKTDPKKCFGCMRCVRLCPSHARALDQEKLSALAGRLEAVCRGRKENELFL